MAAFFDYKPAKLLSFYSGANRTNWATFYHDKLGRPSLPPGQYFRIMMIGFFEGLDSERGIAWRAGYKPVCLQCGFSENR